MLLGIDYATLHLLAKMGEPPFLVLPAPQRVTLPWQPLTVLKPGFLDFTGSPRLAKNLVSWTPHPENEGCGRQGLKTGRETKLGA